MTRFPQTILTTEEPFRARTTTDLRVPFTVVLSIGTLPYIIWKNTSSTHVVHLFVVDGSSRKETVCLPTEN